MLLATVKPMSRITIAKMAACAGCTLLGRTMVIQHADANQMAVGWTRLQE